MFLSLSGHSPIIICHDGTSRPSLAAVTLTSGIPAKSFAANLVTVLGREGKACNVIVQTRGSETLWRKCEGKERAQLVGIRTEDSNAASGRIPGTVLQAFGSADDAWARESLQMWVWRSRIM